MRIGMILINATGFPPDIRVEKECIALSQAGHEVFVISMTRSIKEVGTSVYFESIGTTVCYVSAFPRSLLTRLFYRLLINTHFWTNLIEEFVRDYRIEAIHAHDLYSLPSSISVGNKLKLPVIADLHENMPAACRAYRDWYSIPKKWFSYVIDNYYWMRLRESQLLKKCSQIIVVVPEAFQRLKDYGINLNRISVVSNTEDESTFSVDFNKIDSELAKKYRDKFVISYIGGIGPHRGIDTSLQAIKLAKDEIPNLLFLIVGIRNKKHLQRISQEVDKLSIGRYVEILEWVPFEKVNMLNLISQICLVPHNNYEHTHTTIPHKLFQYMLCKKPVLVSDCKPLKRVVQDTNSGQIFKANDGADMASKLVSMYNNHDELEQQGKNGYLAATTNYEWSKDAENLVAVYNYILKNKDFKQ